LELRVCADAYRDQVCGDGPNKDPNACARCGGK
jgi:hypothetical protein